MWLTSLSIRRPVFILMVMVTFLVLGFYSYSKMKVELQPNVDFPIVSVATTYPGAGPEEIETLISKKIEDAVSSSSGVKSVDSISREGLSVVTIEFYLGTNIDTAFSDVNAKVSAIRSDLPEDALAPSISKVDSRSEPIMYIGASSPRPSQELRDLADDVFKDKIGRITGVASVVVTGGAQREILVAIRADRLVAYGMTPAQVQQQLASATLNLPAGHVVEGNREYAVRFYGEFQNVDEIKNLKINLPSTQQNSAGASVPLSSIATITDTTAEQRELNRLQKQEAITMVVQKSADANTVEVAKGVKKQVDDLRKQYPDISFVYAQDQSIQVEESLTDVKVSLFLGIFLVVLIVFLFLHNLRGTIIVSIAIPTSIFATFIVMYFCGFTINTMTMLALSLAVGILVDDAIVVLENIYRHLSKGEDPVEASLNGRSEIGLAAITITMIDVVVFLPIAFMGGITGQFFRSFGITVAAATLFSLFVSFTITPMLASRWYRKGEAVEEPHGFFAVLEGIYKRFEGMYRNVLRVALRRRWLVVLLGFGVLFFVFSMVGGSFQPFSAVANPSKLIPSVLFSPFMIIAFVLVVLSLIFRARHLARGAMGLAGLAVALALATVLGASFGRPLLNFRFAPEQDQGQISIKVTMPAGASLAATDAVVRRIEEITTQNPDVEYTTALVGSWSSGLFGGGNSGTRYGELTLKLKDKISFMERALPFLRHGELRTRPDQEIASEIRDKVGTVPGALISVNALSGFAGFGAPVQIAFTGADMNQLTVTAEQAKSIISQVPGIIDADLSWTAGQPEYRYNIDRVKANDFDLSVSDIATNLRTAYEGDTNVKYRVNGKEYDIRVRLGDEQRNNLEALGQIAVGYRNHAPIPLEAVAEREYRNAPTKIERHDRGRQVIVSAYLLPGYSVGNVGQTIDAKLKAAQLPPPGIDMRAEGENATTADEAPYMMQALLLAFILVYILMATLFDDLLTPFIIMLAQPQALTGALLALIVTGAGMSIVAMIGFIMLIGLVGKNAILLIDYTNTLRGRGLPRDEAILEAAPTRLRPILMTTLAMIFGMLPVALAIGRGSEFRAPLGIAVIGGLVLSTVLTLVVIPCTYTLFDDMERWVARKVFKREMVAHASNDPTSASAKPKPASTGAKVDER